MGWGKKKAASDRPTWNQEDYHTEFAGKLTEQIRNGTAPWQKPWKPSERRLPENLHTGNFPLGHRVAVVVAPLECQPVGLLDVKDGVAVATVSLDAKEVAWLVARDLADEWVNGLIADHQRQAGPPSSGEPGPCGAPRRHPPHAPCRSTQRLANGRCRWHQGPERTST